MSVWTSAGNNQDRLRRAYIGLIAVLCFIARAAPAQPVSVSPSFLQSRPVFDRTAVADLQRPAAPQYDVVALRVAFQPDTSRFTTGNGTFSGSLFETLSPTVDPLPHNTEYFDAHLQFLSNYLERVSDGKTTVVTHLIPDVIRVSERMAAYSPTGVDSDSDAELSKLAALVREAWSLADQQSSFDMSGFDPSTTALVLFHAGVGRDIELVGTTLDKTPQDLPTIFFDESSLQRLSPGSISFNGFPVNHTLLLPRTETRQGFDFIQDQPFLVEFSINGLLAASFFNFLGVPDLFDTATGESAIGPFGLMDALGIFAFNGLFPPEPSGWTKKFLGWVDPVEVNGAGPTIVTLDAASSTGESSELARIPISSSEYFLVENRNRDLAGDGLVLTVFRDGQIEQQRYEHGQEDFNSLSIDGFEGGVVIDVDDYDWALPGGRDEDENALIGGMLIWHIDENVIRDGLSTNSVNADPNRRGVDLEEGDSSQDIGFPSGNIFAPQSHLGSPFDFFYEGNPVVVITQTGEEIRLYQNRFGADTYPDSHTNAGGPSFIELSDFSAPGSSMSFQVERVSQAGIERRLNFPRGGDAAVPAGSYLVPLTAPEVGFVFQSGTGAVRIVRENAGEVEPIRRHTLKAPVVLPDGRVVVLQKNAASEPGVLVIQGTGSSSIPLPLTGGSTLDGVHSSLLYDITSTTLYALFTGENSSDVYQIERLEAGVAQVRQVPVSGGHTFSMAATDEGQIALLTEAGVQWTTGGQGWSYPISAESTPGQLTLGTDRTGLVGAFTLAEDGRVVYLQADQTLVEIDVNQYVDEDGSATLSRYPILVDLDGNETLEALVTFGRYLLAFNAGGGLVEGFPIEMPAASNTQPLVLSFESSDLWTIVVGAKDGYLYGFDLAADGRMASGFPLAVGAGIVSTPLWQSGLLYGMDSSGSTQVWALDAVDDVWWSQQFGNRFNTSYVRVPASGPAPPSTELLPAEETYNWPNPIRNGETFFRLAPTQDVSVTITIIDAAGALIDELSIESVRGNTASDIQWQTSASSGLYYARVKAVTASGDSQTEMIKMAIVR